MTKSPDASNPRSDDISDQASRSTLALNPLVGLRGRDLVDSTMILLNAIAKEPALAANQWLSFWSEIGSIASGKSERKPEAGDKRFVDATWKNSTVHRGLLQAYLAWWDSLNKFIDQTGLSDIDKTRAHLVASMFVDAIAPTNNLLSNPAALRQVVDTGGESLWRGLKNFVEDLGKNGGLPSQIDKSRFKVGENLATTPGAVVSKASNADEFLAGAEKKSGSWWLHWRNWLAERSGEETPAPATLGSARHPARAPAPGTYVFD